MLRSGCTFDRGGRNLEMATETVYAGPRRDQMGWIGVNVDDGRPN